MIGKIKGTLRECVKLFAFKAVYPAVYHLFCLKRQEKTRVLMCEVRHGFLTDSFKPIYDSLAEKGTDVKVFFIHNNSGGLGYLWRYLKLCTLLPTAGCVVIDDTCNLFGAFRLRKGTKLVQTWHSCGAFKKWGYSIAGLSFGDEPKALDRYPAHDNYTLVTVSGEECIRHFDSAFGFDRDRFKNQLKKTSPVKAIGVARTDCFFDENNRRAAFDKLYTKLPNAKGKKIVLYAPTYRGDADKALAPEMFDIPTLLKNVPDCLLLIKQHGFVKTRTTAPKGFEQRVFDVSDDFSIEELLFVSDVCVTDYSSLVFEYSLFLKPMIFYAYDLDEFYDYRGFFYKYDEDFLPGDIVRTQDELAVSLANALDGNFDKDRIMKFREKFMGACDGGSTERIVKYILG